MHIKKNCCSGARGLGEVKPTEGALTAALAEVPSFVKGVAMGVTAYLIARVIDSNLLGGKK